MTFEKIKTANEESKKTGKLVLLILISFFLIIFIVNGIFIYNAETTWRGIVTDDSYQKGLHYNQVIAIAKKQSELGWKIEINYNGNGIKTGILSVVMKDKNGLIINNGKISAQLIRPTQDGFDFEAILPFDNKSNSYKSVIHFPIHGLWRVDITAYRDHDVYRNSRRIVID